MDDKTTPRPPHDENVSYGREPPPPLDADQPDPLDPAQPDTDDELPPDEHLEPL